MTAAAQPKRPRAAAPSGQAPKAFALLGYPRVQCRAADDFLLESPATSEPPIRPSLPRSWPHPASPIIETWLP
ncbi:hypothetical protein U9M48_038502 [Paspalum notatum var. saurae]|uniref:Uncharacterized protein n=1 Tax=Paspalum notatum var. saurae TaxID=547442 RepID=A0AAQ3ULG0_PASNO